MLTENHPSTLLECQICKQMKPHREMIAGDTLRPPLLDLARRVNPDWKSEDFICVADLNTLRTEYVTHLLNSEKGDLTKLTSDAEKSLQDYELLSQNLQNDPSEQRTFGQMVSDKIAEFGGSWKFLFAFAGFMGFWILWNIITLFVAHRFTFDPYPYILLNLCLSCLAAVQAPVIMMSQNRQEARDRKRAESDYRINLKAEMEIRNLHDKMDHLVEHQWQYMMEIQQLQMELMAEIMAKKAQ